MASRQTSWPRRWMMTDERCGERLWPALDALPEGSGVVFRHHRTPAAERHAMAVRIGRIARTRGLFLSIAGDAALAAALNAAAVHNPAKAGGPLPFSRSVHSMSEALEARASGAGLVFVSPVYPTASHADAILLGLDRALALARASGLPAIALGGIDHRRGKEAIRSGFHGWAAIDAWHREAD